METNFFDCGHKFYVVPLVIMSLPVIQLVHLLQLVLPLVTLQLDKFSKVQNFKDEFKSSVFTILILELYHQVYNCENKFTFLDAEWPLRCIITHQKVNKKEDGFNKK